MQTKEYLLEVEINIREQLYEMLGIDNYEVIQVWYCKTVQNHKGLFIVKNEEDIILPYFIEATYNGDAKELYLDFYTKQFKHTIKVE